jgi:CRP/FNR family transcriptional regulator
VITHRASRRPQPKLIEPAPRPPQDGDALGALRARATPIRARRHQQLSVGGNSTENIYVVRSGLLVVQASPPDRHRQLLALLYPGDIFRAAFAPPLPATTLVAASAADLWRLPAVTFDELLSTDPDLGRGLSRQLTDQQARCLMHTAIVGGMSGEERAASFLIELTLRLGTKCATGIAFDIPLSRAEIAEYLALNPDTLSRIMSRLKGRGLLVQTGRSRAVVQDWPGLCAQSPMAEALIKLHSKSADGRAPTDR